MKKQIFIISISIFIIFGIYNEDFVLALGVGDYGSPGSYSCYHQINSQCWISQTAYYDNYAAFAITQHPTEILITNKSGTQSCTYFYLPDSLDNSVGLGVIDGFLQYYPNNPDSTVYFYTDANSSFFYDYSSWPLLYLH